MKTLVTGGTGFVASNIIRTLAEQGEQVVSFDLVPPSDLLRAYIEPWAERVTFIQGDILSQDELDAVLEQDIKRIVHAAVFTGLFPNIEAGRSRDIVAINVMGTTNVLEMARKLSHRAVPLRQLWLGLRRRPSRQGADGGEHPASAHALCSDEIRK